MAYSKAATLRFVASLNVTLITTAVWTQFQTQKRRAMLASVDVIAVHQIIRNKRQTIATRNANAVDAYIMLGSVAGDAGVGRGAGNGSE